MYYIYLIHVHIHVACILKKMQRLILKYFLKTCIQQAKLQLRFSIQIKRRLVVIVDVHMQFSEPTTIQN